MVFSRLLVGFASVALIAALASGFTGCSRSGEAERRVTKTHVVNIRGMTFEPRILHVNAGDVVQWINRDIVPHAVKSTERGEAWQSKDLPPGEAWTKTATTSGAYLCPYHPAMTGEIVVVPP